MGLLEQSTLGCFPELCFPKFSVAQVLVGLRKQLMNNDVLPTRACAAGFDNNNSILNKVMKKLASDKLSVGVLAILCKRFVYL